MIKKMPAVSTGRMLVSLKSLLGNSVTSHPSKPPQTRQQPPRKIISETLLEELEFQIKDNEAHARDLQKKRNEDLGRPDYSWLMDVPKSYRLPQMIRLEIEEISRRIDLSDVCGIITDFRNSIDHDIPVDKLHVYLKFIINSHLQDKKKRQASKHKLEQYKQVRIGQSSIPERSQSSAVIKKSETREDIELCNRPQSAPVPNNWKRRAKVHPVQVPTLYSGHGENSNRTHVIELADCSDVMDEEISTIV